MPNKNPYIIPPGGKALVTAHRGGALLNPENTLMAFEYCVKNHDKFKVDFFELDLHLTADNRLVLIHDDILDRVTNSVEVFGEENILVRNKTYDELRRLNFGANFCKDGKYPYRNLETVPENLKAIAFDDLLDYIEGEAPGRYKYIIDVKHGKNDGRLGVDMLVKILKERGLLERVIFGTLRNEITAYVTEKYPKLPRSAGINETIAFFFRSLLDLPLKKVKYIALQVPPSQYKVFVMGTKRFINYCHKHNLSAQYWTINDEAMMEKLLSFGADMLMTDLPDVVYEKSHGVSADKVPLSLG